MEKPILFFDGVCGMCNFAVDFFLHLDRHQRILFAPLQGLTAQQMLPPLPEDHREWSVLYWDGGVLHDQSDAPLAALRRIGGLGTLLSLARFAPHFLRDPTYRLIARNRYRLFRQQSTCRLPTAEERTRFLP